MRHSCSSSVTVVSDSIVEILNPRSTIGFQFLEHEYICNVREKNGIHPIQIFQAFGNGLNRCFLNFAKFRPDQGNRPAREKRETGIFGVGESWTKSLDSTHP